jgi:predicted  nucleic acid-binding Zn-ribbon protein
MGKTEGSMTDNSFAISSLRQQINQKQRRIEELGREVLRLRDEVDALHQMQAKTEQYQSALNDSINRQRRRASIMAAAQSSRLAGSYPGFLENGFTGDCARIVAERFYQAVADCHNGIQRCEDDIYFREQEIHHLNDEVRALQNRIGYLASLG